MFNKTIEKALKGTDYEGLTFGQLLGKTLGSWLAQITGSQATGRDRDLANIQLENQQTLNEEEYDRKIDFYERYESPEARVRQYKTAGLNPMLLAGNGASVSASGGVGSAGAASATPSGSGGLPDVIGSILGVMRFGVERKIAQSEIAQRRASTDAQVIDNEYKRQLNELEIEQRRKNIEKTGSEISINLETVKKVVSEAKFAETYALYAPQLFDSQISQNLTTSELNQARAERERVEASVSQERINEIRSITAKNWKEVAVMDATIDRINAECYEIATRADLNEQQIKESKARIDKMTEEVKLIGKQIGLADNDIKYYVWNHSKDVSNNLGAGIKIHKEAFANDPKVAEWSNP